MTMKILYFKNKGGIKHKMADRPFGITILAVLAILLSLSILLGAAGLIVGSAVIDDATVDEFDNKLEEQLGENIPEFVKENAVMILLAVGIFFLIIGLFWFAMGYGFIKGLGWSWTIAMVLIIITLLMQIFNLVVDRTVEAIGNSILGIVILFVMLYYLTRPYVKSWFGKA